MTTQASKQQQRYAAALIDLAIAVKRKKRIRERGNPLLRLHLNKFIPKINKNYSAPLHLRPITDFLEALDTEPVRVAYTVPPRHAKTETILHAIARFIARHPEKTVAYCSYSQTFANSQARKIHRLLKRLGVQPGDTQTVQEWRTAQGGGLLATGIGGALTGQGVHLLVVDDALKNRQDADSITIRNAQWEWFCDVAETRIEPGGSIVVLMTRWHEDDLLGRLAEQRQDEFKFIRIPALADGLDAFGKKAAPDPLGREIGEALWPRTDEKTQDTSFDKPHLERIRAVKKPTFDSLYQGLPRSKHEKLFPDAEYYTKLPPGLKYSAGIDLAYSEKTRANHSAIVVLGWKFEPVEDVETQKIIMQGTAYVIHAERWQAEMSATRAKLHRLQSRWPFSFGAEYNGPQKGIVDLLRAGDSNGQKRIRITSLLPLTDKLARSQDASEMWRCGRILLPFPVESNIHEDDENMPTIEHGIKTHWVDEFLTELHDFTGIGDISDDYVDALAWAIERKPQGPPLDSQRSLFRENWRSPRRM